MPKPVTGSYPPYFENYISQVTEDDLQKAFKNQEEVVNHFFDSITEEKSAYAYAPKKWTLKELLQHVIDAERIFNYRALCFARKETASLPGFDENTYAANSSANERSWKSLCDELKAVRKTTEMLYDSFNTEMMNTTGMANNKPTIVNALGFITIGHLYHHKKVIESRYL
jgi:uncharacterized damage-inducible protein DinB